MLIRPMEDDDGHRGSIDTTLDGDAAFDPIRGDDTRAPVCEAHPGLDGPTVARTPAGDSPTC